jgi:hypothetical protein
MRSTFLRLLFLFAAAEMLASMAVWSGTPTDWGNNEPLHFWHFEALRLGYWFGFGVVFACVWAISWAAMRRYYRSLELLLLACALGTELMTSVYFRRSLSVVEAGFLGWPSSGQYVEDHLLSWIVVTLLGLAVFYFCKRCRRARLASTKGAF